MVRGANTPDARGQFINLIGITTPSGALWARPLEVDVFVAGRHLPTRGRTNEATNNNNSLIHYYPTFSGAKASLDITSQI